MIQYTFHLQHSFYYQIPINIPPLLSLSINMPNYFIFLSSLLFFIISFWQYKKENTALALIGILIGGLLLRLGVSTDPFLHCWDERYHALVAKHLMSRPFFPTLYETPLLPYDYRTWTGNYIWLHKQPLPLWGMALSMKLFGINEFAVRIPSILLSTASIYLTFRIAKAFTQSDRISLLAAFLHAINGLIIEITGGRVATDHIDLFFLFFIELGVFFACRYMNKQTLLNCFLIGISIGLAILCKWLTALIVVPIWLIISFQRQHVYRTAFHLFVILLSAVVIFLPWELYIHSRFPLEASWEAASYSKHVTQVLNQQSGGYFYFAEKVAIVFNEFFPLIIGWHIYALIKKKYNAYTVSLLVWFFIPVIFFSIAKTKMQAYILFTGPALFILTAMFVYDISRLTIKNKADIWIRNGLIFFTIALPLRYSLERLKLFQKQNPQEIAITQRIKKLNNSTISDKTVIFNDPNYIETMFYTNFTSYEHKPSDPDIALLKNNGYGIFVMPDLDN
jgi:4-amino-4-deoxy-L-arabinose transferase-like glycosyltransferase